MRCMILHVPNRHDGRNEIMVMPMGVFSIASALKQAGNEVAIFNEGIEIDLDAAFSARELVRRANPDVLFVALHWTKQIRPVIDRCEQLRRAAPAARIVLGGFCASYFAEEILARCPFVDAVIRGDAELPAVAYVEALADGSPLREVPNLAYRQGQRIAINPLTAFTGPQAAEALDHACFQLLRNYREYLSRCLYADFDTEAPRGSAQRYRGAFFYNPGRGCPYRCTYCGGSWWAREMVDAPGRYFFYSLEKATRDIERAQRYGARTIRTSFDPTPRRDYYLGLFERLRRRGLPLRLVFDCFALPDDRLLAGIAETFSTDSVVVISAEGGSEEIRRRNRGAPFTNQELLDALASIQRHGLASHTFLAAGLPFETSAHIDETASLIHRLLDETATGVTVCPMELDPGSRLFAEPERFGVTLELRTFDQLYENGLTEARPFYATEHLSEPEIVDAVQRLTGLARAGA